VDDREIRRCRVQILPSPDGQPCGWGVIVSPQRILTCTHVVDDALSRAGGEPLWLKFPSLPGQPRLPVRRTAIRFPTLPDDLPQSDISVLELDGGHVPSDAVVVRPCFASFDSAEELFGYALRDGLDKGHPIRGTKQDSLYDHRITFVAEQPDLVTRAGASGTPLFLEARGMVGIVVAAQAQQTGFYIPVDVLADHVPELKTAFAPESVRPWSGAQGLNAEQMLRAELGDRIHLLDRTPQCATFRSRLAAARVQAGNSFVCSIAGTADDLPSYCRAKIEQEVRQTSAAGLRAAVGASAGAELARALPPQPLPWPAQRRFEPDRALQGIVRSLHPALSAQRPPYTGKIRTVLNDELSPLLYYSEVDPRAFTDAHRELLGQWLDVLDELNQEPLAQPFVHFLMFQFRHRGAAEPANDDNVEEQLDALLADHRGGSFLQALFRRSARSELALDTRNSFARLPALGLVDRSETREWIAAVAAAMRLRPDEGSIGRVQRDYLRDFEGEFGVRMRRIERRSLALEGV
jgi:hypothetical protein